ncbi:hypothetical protein T03_4498 [Trichinella britovi]|uniref:Uncharacterized protein n=1 Tax=Trichinella britovi TaxID=45882 RepID=A0A0V1D1U8_TRIBR|nr:hypothetical protein T03_4498 [Trichinella britovi]
MIEADQPFMFIGAKRALPLCHQVLRRLTFLGPFFSAPSGFLSPTVMQCSQP